MENHLEERFPPQRKATVVHRLHETTFPQLYADFKMGDFVVHHTERKASEFRLIMPWKRSITNRLKDQEGS